MFQVIIEPMQSHIDGGITKSIVFPRLDNAISVFTEWCDLHEYEITEDMMDFEWTAGGVGHDYRLTLKRVEL